jgi:glycogen synthase
LSRILRQGRYDIVHLHSSKAGLIGRLAVALARVPAAVIYTPNAFAFQGQHGCKRSLYIAVERLLKRWTTRLVCVSPAERDEAVRERITTLPNIVVIENAVPGRDLPTAAEKTASRQALSLPAEGPVVGCVGRLSAQKGQRF